MNIEPPEPSVPSSSRLPLLAGSIFGGLAVVLGAFGAHWLKDAVQDWGLDTAEQARRLETWEVAVRYQMYHALALIAVGLLRDRYPSSKLVLPVTWLFIAGIGIFSGLLYALVVTGIKVLGAIVPIGGLAMIVGWLLLAYVVAVKR